MRRFETVPWRPSVGVLVDGPLPASVVGDGPLRLVLLHGMFNSSRYWGAAYDPLASPGRAVAPDLLGFGRGPRPSTGYGADDHADAVAATLRALDATGPAVIAAHSIGGLVALRLAARHPALVSAVVAFAPPIYPTPRDAQAGISRVDPLARLLTANPRLAARACAVMCRHRRLAAGLVRLLRPSLPAALAADRVEHSWASYSQTVSQLVIAAEAPGWLDDVKVPVRFVAGTDDRALDHAFLAGLASRHPHVDLEEVAGGHDLPLARADLCVGAIRATLAAVDRADG